MALLGPPATEEPEGPRSASLPALWKSRSCDGARVPPQSVRGTLETFLRWKHMKHQAQATCAPHRGGSTIFVRGNNQDDHRTTMTSTTTRTNGFRSVAKVFCPQCGIQDHGVFKGFTILRILQNLALRETTCSGPVNNRSEHQVLQNKSAAPLMPQDGILLAASWRNTQLLG